MSINKPILIGITCKSSKKKYYLPKFYVSAILESGGTPLLLPDFKASEHIEHLINLIDGLLLAGGGDIHPKFYNEAPQAKLKRVNPSRDEYEFELLRKFAKTGKPILGICRGIQVINVAFGGNLYQDIENLTKIKHWQEEPDNSPSHDILIKENTLLHQILGTTHLKVNSFHHQAIKNIAHGFLVSAYAPDNIVEAIEYPDHKFFLGIQCHPECMHRQGNFRKIFDRFVEACRCCKD